MDFTAVKESVGNSYAKIRSSRCDCGGLLKPNGQALGYCDYLGTMVDFIDTKCQTCCKDRMFVFPVPHFKMEHFVEGHLERPRLDVLRDQAKAINRASDDVKCTPQYKEYALAAREMIRKVAGNERIEKEIMDDVEAKGKAVELLMK